MSVNVLSVNKIIKLHQIFFKKTGVFENLSLLG